MRGDIKGKDLVMLRKSILVAVSIASIGLVSAPAQAKDVDKGKLSPTKVEGICGEKDGTYFANPDGSNYGCGYKGGGGILCDKDTGCLETTREQDDRDFPWGLAGLLGLIGLVGLTRRDGGAKANPA
jgi:hypothetical protein